MIIKLLQNWVFSVIKSQNNLWLIYQFLTLLLSTVLLVAGVCLLASLAIILIINVTTYFVMIMNFLNAGFIGQYWFDWKSFPGCQCSSRDIRWLLPIYVRLPHNDLPRGLRTDLHQQRVRVHQKWAYICFFFVVKK